MDRLEEFGKQIQDVDQRLSELDQKIDSLVSRSGTEMDLHRVEWRMSHPFSTAFWIALGLCAPAIVWFALFMFLTAGPMVLRSLSAP